MKPLPKMTVEEYTLPVGNECSCASLLEAKNLARNMKLSTDNAHLMLLTTFANERPFCWCYVNDDKSVSAFFNVFHQDPLPQSLPKSGNIMQGGEFIYHDRDMYYIKPDKDLGYVIRRVGIFASQSEAAAVYKMSPTGQTLGKKTDDAEYYLVNLSLVSNPAKKIAVCWYISCANTLYLRPVFIEDEALFNEIDNNDLNWDFLKAGNIFCHNDMIYQVCQDEDEEYYIASTRTSMRLIRCKQ